MSEELTSKSSKVGFVQTCADPKMAKIFNNLLFVSPNILALMKKSALQVPPNLQIFIVSGEYWKISLNNRLMSPFLKLDT